VVLRYYAHLSEQQMASVLGVASGTVKSRLSRAVKALAQGPGLSRTAGNTMIESKVTELLERAGERTNVGPPPIDAIRAGATRLRRRRTVALSVASAAAVVAAAGGTALVAIPGTSPEDSPLPAASTGTGVVPAGMRLVGLGHVAVAVPEEWGTNQIRCATPHKDTVVIDLGVIGLCAVPRPTGVESVELAGGTPPSDFHADETFEVDGVRAERQRTRCTATFGGVTVCRGAVFLPSLGVWFRAESSTDAGEVDRLLERILIVPDRVGVPGFHTAPIQDAKARSGQKYADALTELGLEPKIQTRKSPGPPPGEILAVSPAPGTMLTPGQTVTITVAAEP
jgi:hypothetical protein